MSRRQSVRDAWDELLGRYREKGIALTLGAGVSAGCAIPTWEGLLTRIAKENEGLRGEKLVKDLRARGYSLPMIAGVLEARYKKVDFAEAIRNALYADFSLYRQKLDKRNAQRLIDLVRSSNNTLAAVGAFCAKRDNRAAKFVPNDKVLAIANTNFDALLTRYIYARYKAPLLRTVERPSASASRGRIHTYHVHGFFHFELGRVGNPEEEAPDIRVLTEHEFFDFFNAPNAMFNYTLLFLFREYSMVFIGLSMQDDNLRRLLHYSARERVQSKVREGRQPRDAERSMVRHFAFQQQRDWATDCAIEQSLLRLGVRVLWYKDHDDIATKLGELYSSTGEDWTTVYA
jgi:hypothetical protein